MADLGQLDLRGLQDPGQARAVAGGAFHPSDLAPHVGVDLERMVAEAREVRGGRPVVLTNCRTGDGVDGVVRAIRDAVPLGSGSR